VIAYLFDHTALLALGAGNHNLSKLVDRAHRHQEGHLYVPALCLIAAEAERAGVADHVGALPAIEIIELGFGVAGAVGRLVADEVDWRFAHAVNAGRPSVEWPTGRTVLTRVPETYKPWGVATIPVLS
jgi:hypothetical protein